MAKQAVIAGATGLVGRALLNYCLEQCGYERVYVLQRRPQAYVDVRVQPVLVDYDRLHTCAGRFSASHYYCCLGSTLQIAATRARFYRIDMGYVYRFAQLAEMDKQCTQCLILTSFGANRRSIFFYNRVKGRAEQAVFSCKIPGIHVLRPSILLGKRVPPRFYERMAKVCMIPARWLHMEGAVATFAIAAVSVAQAMYHIAQATRLGTHIYLPRTIYRISKYRSLQ